jgi:hypothetical protein
MYVHLWTVFRKSAIEAGSNIYGCFLGLEEIVIDVSVAVDGTVRYEYVNITS